MKGLPVKLHTVLLTAAASIGLAACNPAPEAPAPVVPPAADLAAPTPESGPAAPNTADTLSSTPPATDAAPAPAPATTPAAPAAKVSAEAAATTKEELASGSAVYARSCAMCHGPTGGGTAMGAAIATRDLALIQDKIARGMLKDGDKMPPMGTMISADDADDVAKFIAAGLPAL